MTRPVDVREILDRRAAHMASLGQGQAALELRDAKEAVAELIEAGNDWCDLMPGLAGGPEFDRFVAALANAGGTK